MTANHALQRTRRERRGCNPCVPCAGSPPRRDWVVSPLRLHMVYARDIEVEMTFLTPEEGGRHTPARQGYRPQFYYDGHDSDAAHTYVGTDEVLPGQTVRAYLTFLSPDRQVGRIRPGLEFLIREGSRTVARGRVLQVLKLEQSAQRVQSYRR
jgi:hypothetical protein